MYTVIEKTKLLINDAFLFSKIVKANELKNNLNCLLALEKISALFKAAKESIFGPCSANTAVIKKYFLIKKKLNFLKKFASLTWH